MSLLMNYNDQKFIEIAQLIFDEQFRRDPKLEKELDDRRKRLMYDDVIYNISYLMTAVQLDDSKIFEGYALWVYDLLCHIMKDLDREHYATTVTQTVMSQFYDDIFDQPRKSRALVSCAVGSELHEMGIRMLSDIFEYNG
jgi:hypothetical protein